jgi:hypothetical protein
MGLGLDIEAPQKLYLNSQDWYQMASCALYGREDLPASDWPVFAGAENVCQVCHSKLAKPGDGLDAEA